MPFHYVYILRSIDHPEETYIGQTAKPAQRLAEHNRGKCSYTRAYAPWRFEAVIALADRAIGLRFEHYLKSGSGRAFANKHWRAR